MATRLQVMAYSPEQYLEEVDIDLERLDELRSVWPVLWIEVIGLAKTELLAQLRERFALHPLVMEDVVNVGQRPKVEEYEDYDFIVLRTVEPDLTRGSEQLSLVLKDGCVLVFHERPSPYLEPVRERIRRSMGRIRHARADYLTYSILDAVIDHYVPVLDAVNERIEAMERRIILHPDPGHVAGIYALRHQVQELRRAVRPVLDVVGRLYNEEVPLFSDEMKPYLRDCLDHAVRLVDAVDQHRETATSLMELHLSSLSQRMNEIMKVLTIIATIFIPLSFVVGLYGMNFDPATSPWNMPELRWRWGYPFVLGLMGAMVALMLLYFFRKGWLGNGSREDGNGAGDHPDPRP